MSNDKSRPTSLAEMTDLDLAAFLNARAKRTRGIGGYDRYHRLINAARILYGNVPMPEVEVEDVSKPSVSVRDDELADFIAARAEHTMGIGGHDRYNRLIDASRALRVDVPIQ